jgi:hypothetical protein
MKGFKGFDKNLKCHGKRYEIGQTFEETEASLCNKGLHFCEYPLDCFGYYPPAESRFAEIEAEDVSDEKKEGDSKRVAKKITIKGELSLKGFIEAAIKFTFDRAVWMDNNKATGDRGAASATGDHGAASATGCRGAASATGDQGAASATGDQGAASATGWRGAASVKGKESIALASGVEGKASGALGCWIVLAEWEKDKNDNWHIKRVKTAKVNGKNIKPDTFYRLKNGKFKKDNEE